MSSSALFILFLNGHWPWQNPFLKTPHHKESATPAQAPRHLNRLSHRQLEDPALLCGGQWSALWAFWPKGLCRKEWRVQCCRDSSFCRNMRVLKKIFAKTSVQSYDICFYGPNKTLKNLFIPITHSTLNILAMSRVY
jgi:hypothetical protein